MEISRVDSLKHHDELADRYPILTKHWGLPPSDEPPVHIRDHRLQRDVDLLHRRGPRTLLEFLTAVGVERGITTFFEDEISAFADLDPDALAALGARDLPPVPLHEVPA